MSSSTKILVVKMKEIIFTIIFAVLGIVLLILLFIIFTGKSHKKVSETSAQTYYPGVYTSSIILSTNPVDIEVIVDSEQIKAINLINTSESVTTMYPLITSSLEDISAQIIKNNSIDSITYSDDARYTSIVLINAVDAALDKARVD